MCTTGADPTAGGARVEAPNRVGCGEGCPLPSRLGDLGERRELPSGISGKAT